MNHSYIPRDYMSECIDQVFVAWQESRSTLMVMATGTGKTEAYLQVAERFTKENSGQKVMILAHREELITQPAKRWRRNCDEWPAIEMAEMRSDFAEEADLFDGRPTNKNVVIASIPTLNSGRRCRNCTADCQECGATGKTEVDCSECDGSGVFQRVSGDSQCYECDGQGIIRKKCERCEGDGWICILDDCEVCFEHFVRRMQKFNPAEFGLLIIDEAHHAVADTYTRIIRYFRSEYPDIKILGCTATPDRADEEAMGKVFESVAFVYNLPQPIFDGWLVPIDQQFITIKDLNLANVRTTAGDLNSGDLEREMMAEKVLHKVTTPIVEISCGLPSGTIDKLIAENRLHDLANMVTKAEPTLIHAVDVAHAERMAEIINRYLPDAALCIIGTTPKNERREGLKKFAKGGYQFLLSCGVFLEGTDLPNVSIIAIARPTKSRALYAQMLGRGLRTLSGLVDSIRDAAERVRLIAASQKPKCLVIDFVGNSGRHKLISSADILGDAMPDELVEGVIRKAAQAGQPVDILQALQQAKDEAERRQRQKAWQDAQNRQAQEQAAKQRAAQRRQGIVAGTTYDLKSINPFDVLELTPQREPGWHKGRMPTEKQKQTLQNFKIPFTEKTTFWEASQLIGKAIDRLNKGLCSFKQAAWLQKNGYSPDMKRAECSKVMDAWEANGWRRPTEDIA